MEPIEPHEERIKREIARHLLTQKEPIIAFLKGKIQEHLDRAEEYRESLAKYEAEETAAIEAETSHKPPIPKIIY